MDTMIRRMFIAVLLMAVALVAATVQVQAQQQSTPLSDEHVQHIRDNCQDASRTLAQIRVNDKLMRVNRAQLYDAISSKLMARLNSRIALNRLDGAKLVTVTAHFDRTLADFRTHYTAYEEKLIDTTKLDCKKEPAKFYASVAQTRELRAKVHEAVQQLDRDMEQYKQEFNSFRASVPSQKSARDE